MSSESVKEETAWEAEYEGLLGALYAGHEVKPDLVLGPETIQAQDIALPVARGYAAYTSNAQPKNEATQDLEEVSATQPDHEDGVSNMHKTEVTQNPRLISTTLEDASASIVLKTVEELESRDISTVHASLQEPSVRKKASIEKNIHLTLTPCYVKLERIAYKKAFICQICQKICTQKPNLMMHILCHTQEEIKTIKIEKKVTKKGNFNCHICGQGLKKKQNFVKHIKNHKKDPFREQMRLKTPKDSITKTYYTCDICGMSTVRKCSLIRHMRRHAKEEPFECEVCKKQFRVAWELVDHIKRASCEPLNETLVVDPPCNMSILQDIVLKSCFVSLERIEIKNKGTAVKKTITETVDIYGESEDSCDEDQQLKNTSIKHVRVHNVEKPFMCTVCNMKFQMEAALQIHSRIHTVKPHSCDVCKRKFRNLQYLDCHKRVHSGEELFTCNICKKQFKRPDQLLIHKRTHTGERPFSCEICQKRFLQRSHLSKHQRTHTGEKPFSCTVCNKKFSDRGCLKNHNRIHTGEKPYSCDICKKTFKVIDSLKLHIRSHTGEKPYKCKVCKKQFSQGANLRTHMKSHGKKSWPFTCHVCEKKFQKRFYLDRHLALHDRDTPYVCNVCGARFKSSSMLSVHARGHYSGELV